MAQLQSQFQQHQRRTLQAPPSGQQQQPSQQQPSQAGPTTQDQRLSTPQQHPQQVSPHPAQPQASQQQQSWPRFEHVTFPSMAHMLSAVSMKKEQLMTQMAFSEERARYFLEHERPLLIEEIRSMAPQGTRQALTQAHTTPSNGNPPSGDVASGRKAERGTASEKTRNPAPPSRTPQPTAAQPSNLPGPGLGQFSAPPSQQPQLAPPPPPSSSIQPQIASDNMGRNLPTFNSQPPNPQAGGPNFSLQTVVTNDPRHSEFKRRFSQISPQIRQLRDQFSQRVSFFSLNV